MTPAPVLYLVSCAAPPVQRISVLIGRAQDRGWDTCLLLTPTAATWLADDLPGLEKLTGHPVRQRYKLPAEDDVLPPPDAIVVCPATFNTLNKWAAGISDTLALGIVTEAIGLGLPLVALPYLNAAQAAHPALDRSVAQLREWGVTVLLGEGGFVPHPPKRGRLDEYPWDAALTGVTALYQQKHRCRCANRSHRNSQVSRPSSGSRYRVAL